MGMKISLALQRTLGIAAPKKRKRESKTKTPRPKPVKAVVPATWVVSIVNYLPPSLAKLLHVHWRKKHDLKKECADLIGFYGRHVPKATGKRRVLITLTRTGVNDRIRDGDNSTKAVLDGLVRAGLLGDDRPEWCECPEPVQIIGEERCLTIVLEEL